jgi:hypothetical protein
VTSIELQWAMKRGYKVTYVHEIHVYDFSTDLFKDYFYRNLRAKIIYDKKPTEENWTTTISPKWASIGFKIPYDELDPNAAKKFVAKLSCNSLWGKFGQREDMDSCRTFTSMDDFLRFYNKFYEESGWSLTFLRTFHRNDQFYGYIYYKANRGDNQQLVGKNVALASFVTAHARLRLLSEMEKLGDRVLYHDTDSILYKYHPSLYSIPDGHILGEWTNEEPGDVITHFVALGPKTYAYKTLKGKNKVKHKGVPLKTAEAQAKICYDNFVRLLKGELDEITTKTFYFQYAPTRIPMTTRLLEKKSRFLYDKNWVDPTTWKTYPWGSRKSFEKAQ